MIALALAAALAQEPDEDEAPEEVIVYGELLVEQARQAVVEELQELGYDAEVLDRGDHVVYRHAAPWQGEVVLYDDGWMRVKRQPLRVEGREVPWAREGTAVAWAGCLVYPWACLRINGAMIGERKWRGVENRTVDRIQPRVETWGDRVADLAVERKSNALPDLLQVLWDEGRPLEPGPVLGTHEARRRAILDYWASRTETVWGDHVRATVESFCRGVVQRSEFPFTVEELASVGIEL